MDIMTAAATCLKLTERKKVSPLTAQETKELADAQAFVQGWAKTAASKKNREFAAMHGPWSCNIEGEETSGRGGMFHVVL